MVKPFLIPKTCKGILLACRALRKENKAVYEDFLIIIQVMAKK